MSEYIHPGSYGRTKSQSSCLTVISKKLISSFEFSCSWFCTCMLLISLNKWNEAQILNDGGFQLFQSYHPLVPISCEMWKSSNRGRHSSSWFWQTRWTRTCLLRTWCSLWPAPSVVTLPCGRTPAHRSPTSAGVSWSAARLFSTTHGKVRGHQMFICCRELTLICWNYTFFTRTNQRKEPNQISYAYWR